MHDLTIIATLAGALAFALVLGWATQRLGLSTLVGYMLAGIVVGPYTPGFVADTALASQMAEIGVVLLMFGVGMHFHPQELLRVWRIAVPGAVPQSVVAAAAGWASARPFGWSHVAGVVFGRRSRSRARWC
jgi:CPA2 family monovalent cation:H+ antiporter-2